jgi:hypothetical protein
MGLFYFNVHSNGVLAKDNEGRHLTDLESARDWAVAAMPGHLRQSARADNTSITIEVCDHNKHTIMAVRLSMRVDRWTAARSRSV